MLHIFILSIAKKDKLQSLAAKVNSVVRSKDEEIKQLKFTLQGLNNNYYNTIIITHARTSIFDWNITLIYCRERKWAKEETRGD